MRAWLAILPTLALAAGVARLLPAPAGVAGMVAGLTAAILLTFACAVASALAGAGPAAALIALSTLAAAVVTAAIARRPPSLTKRVGLPALLAGGVALGHAAALALVPAFGWDFRFEWGLKARLPLGGIADWAWLAWPPNGFSHPGYPPLWNGLLWVGRGLGGTVASAAAAWQAVLCVGLAAACWCAARRGGGWPAALAAVTGAMAPVVWTRTVEHSGYAEPLLAFAAAVALGWLLRWDRGEARALPILCTAAAVLALTKNEGTALAVGIAAGALLTRRRGRLAVAAAALVPAGLWKAAVLLGGVERVAPATDPLERIVALPHAVGLAMTPVLGLVMAAWVLVAVALLGRWRRSVVVAFGVWAVAVIAAYALIADPLPWLVATSLDRVLAGLLPAAAALALGSAFHDTPPVPESP